MTERQCRELFEPANEECTSADHESARPRLNQLCEGCVEVTIGADIEDLKLQPEGVSRCLELIRLGLGKNGIGRIDQQGHDTSSGDQLMQQCQPFRRYLLVGLGYARDVAARTVKAGDEAEPDR